MRLKSDDAMLKIWLNDGVMIDEWLFKIGTIIDYSVDLHWFIPWSDSVIVDFI